MPSTILDAFGNPAVYFGGGSGQLYQRSQEDQRLRPPQANHFDDYISLLSGSRWKQLVSESRSIGSRGIVAAAIMQRADYISGSHWRPYFTGEDSDYGEQAEELLEDTNNIVCTRGARYDWRTFWKLGVTTVVPDGAFFILLTENSDGWPLLQPIEAHRIGQRSFGPDVVKSDSAFTTVKSDEGNLDYISTPYVGLRIINGIIYNQAGAEVAFRVLGPTLADDEDISARDMVYVGAPRWFSEGRPIPQIAPSLLDLLGVDAARTAQLDQQIIHSKLTLIETNDTGKQDPVKAMMYPPQTPQSAAGTAAEVVERGGMRFVKKAGGKIEAHKSDVPSDQWMNYDLRALSSAISAMGWRMEMLDPSDLSGSATRAFQDQINTLILNGFEDFRPAARRCTRYRIAKFTKMGLLPDHPEFMKFNITPPPEFVVDRNSAKVDVEMVRAGADSMPHVHRRGGLRSRQVLVSQAKYEKMKEQVSAQYGVAVELLGKLSLPGDPLAAAATDPTNKQTAVAA